MIANIQNQDLEAVRRCYLFSGLEDQQFGEVVGHGGTVARWNWPKGRCCSIRVMPPTPSIGWPMG